MSSFVKKLLSFKDKFSIQLITVFVFSFNLYGKVHTGCFDDPIYPNSTVSVLGKTDADPIIFQSPGYPRIFHTTLTNGTGLFFLRTIIDVPAGSKFYLNFWDIELPKYEQTTSQLLQMDFANMPVAHRWYLGKPPPRIEVYGPFAETGRICITFNTTNIIPQQPRNSLWYESKFQIGIYAKQIILPLGHPYNGICGNINQLPSFNNHMKRQIFFEKLKQNGTPRIIGGMPAYPGEFPHQALVVEFSINPETQQTVYANKCGGTLISDQWVITSDHCVENYGAVEWWQVLLGGHEFPPFYQYYPPRPYEYGPKSLEKIVRHPNGGRLTYDIALLKMDSRVNLTPRIFPACFPGPDYEYKRDKTVTTSGWGYTQDDPQPVLATVLQRVDLSIEAPPYCESYLRYGCQTGQINWPCGNSGQEFTKGYNKTYIFCASRKPFSRYGVCLGDIGGPAVDMTPGGIQYPGGLDTVIGVTSFIPQRDYSNSIARCADRNGIPYSYFASTQPAWDWIYETIDGKPLLIKKRWRDDLKCGPAHTLENRQPSECDPNNVGYQCCSATVDGSGRCGNDCSCSGCIDYRVQEMKRWRDDLRCGPRFPLADGSTPAQCNPNGPNGYGCCSRIGWCGNTPEHCNCGSCIDYRPQD